MRRHPLQASLNVDGVRAGRHGSGRSPRSARPGILHLAVAVGQTRQAQVHLASACYADPAGDPDGRSRCARGPAAKPVRPRAMGAPPPPPRRRGGRATEPPASRPPSADQWTRVARLIHRELSSPGQPELGRAAPSAARPTPPDELPPPWPPVPATVARMSSHIRWTSWCGRPPRPDGAASSAAGTAKISHPASCVDRVEAKRVLKERAPWAAASSVNRNRVQPDDHPGGLAVVLTKP